VDGQLADWGGIAPLDLHEGSQPGGDLRTAFDGQNLYLAFTVPTFDITEAKQSGFTDEVQIGLARRMSDTDFGSDLLRLGLNRDRPQVWDRTPGHDPAATLPGVERGCRTEAARTTYEIAIPLRLLKKLKAGAGSRLILDLSFPVPDRGTQSQEPSEPSLNTFAYRVRYGSDSLLPVYFVGLNLERKR
jgi:hypothetical protein